MDEERKEEAAREQREAERQNRLKGNNRRGR